LLIRLRRPLRGGNGPRPHLVLILFVNGNRAWLTEVQSRPGLLPNQLAPEINNCWLRA